jgi:hypothetical protein
VFEGNCNLNQVSLDGGDHSSATIGTGSNDLLTLSGSGNYLHGTLKGTGALLVDNGSGAGDVLNMIGGLSTANINNVNDVTLHLANSGGNTVNVANAQGGQVIIDGMSASSDTLNIAALSTDATISKEVVSGHNVTVVGLADTGETIQVNGWHQTFHFQDMNIVG